MEITIQTPYVVKTCPDCLFEGIHLVQRRRYAGLYYTAEECQKCGNLSNLQETDPPAEDQGE